MIRSENSLKKDLKGFLLQGLFILIFFVLFFISAILPTLMTFVKKRITKVVKWQSCHLTNPVSVFLTNSVSVFLTNSVSVRTTFSTWFSYRDFSPDFLKEYPQRISVQDIRKLLETIDFTRFLIGDTFRNFVKKRPQRISPSRSFRTDFLCIFSCIYHLPHANDFCKKDANEGCKVTK